MFDGYVAGGSTTRMAAGPVGATSTEPDRRAGNPADHHRLWRLVIGVGSRPSTYSCHYLTTFWWSDGGRRLKRPQRSRFMCSTGRKGRRPLNELVSVDETPAPDGATLPTLPGRRRPQGAKILRRASDRLPLSSGGGPRTTGGVACPGHERTWRAVQSRKTHGVECVPDRARARFPVRPRQLAVQSGCLLCRTVPACPVFRVPPGRRLSSVRRHPNTGDVFLGAGPTPKQAYDLRLRPPGTDGGRRSGRPVSAGPAWLLVPVALSAAWRGSRATRAGFAAIACVANGRARPDGPAYFAASCSLPSTTWWRSLSTSPPAAGLVLAGAVVEAAGPGRSAAPCREWFLACSIRPPVVHFIAASHLASSLCRRHFSTSNGEGSAGPANGRSDDRQQAVAVAAWIVESHRSRHGRKML